MVRTKRYMGFTLSEEDADFLTQYWGYGRMSRGLHEIIEYFRREKNICAELDNVLKDYNLGKIDRFELMDIYLTMEKITRDIHDSSIIDDLINEVDREKRMKAGELSLAQRVLAAD